MDISIWFTTLSIFCYQTTRIKMYVLQWMVLCKIIIYYWNTFTEYRIYYTRNVTAMLGQLDSIWIIRRGGWSFNNLKIVLTVTIFDGLIILPLLFYTINLGGPGSSRWTTKIRLNFLNRSGYWKYRGPVFINGEIWGWLVLKPVFLTTTWVITRSLKSKPPIFVKM